MNIFSKISGILNDLDKIKKDQEDIIMNQKEINNKFKLVIDELVNNEIVKEHQKRMHEAMAQNGIEVHWNKYSVTIKKESYKETVNLRELNSSLLHFGDETFLGWIEKINTIYEEQKNI